LTIRARILVVDDDECILETTAIALELEGFSVDKAKNGKEAIEKSYANFYNVAIVDWRLPDIEGTKLLGELKETTPEMVKIMLIGYPSMNNAVDAINKRADAFFMKPVDFEVLLKKVEELLREQEESVQYSEERVASFIETRLKKMVESKTNSNSVTPE
jgi:UDP-3-O-[3-hydroxymyristoyl] N-acetylglucosamine deacetylase